MSTEHLKCAYCLTLNLINSNFNHLHLVSGYHTGQYRSRMSGWKLETHCIPQSYQKSVRNQTRWERITRCWTQRRQRCRFWGQIIISIKITTKQLMLDVPGGTSGKDSACQWRRHKRHSFDPWIGKISWRRAWPPTPGFLPGEFHRQSSLEGYSPWGHKRYGHNWSDLACKHLC